MDFFIGEILIDEVTSLNRVSRRKTGWRCNRSHRYVKSDAQNARQREWAIEIKRAEDLSTSETIDVMRALP
jgi:hypothetical protein